MSRIRILSAVSEIFPLVKTGGLADVAGALPLALAENGVDVTSLVPGYPAVMKLLESPQEILAEPELFGGPARLLSAGASGLDLLVIDAPHLFDRAGGPYLGPDGRDWPDNALRFGALGWMAAQIGSGQIASLTPDIVHCHDWQAALAPAYLAYGEGRRCPSIVTIHNLAYQGQYPAELLSALRLPPHSFQIGGVEYYGAIGFLKAGLQFADGITTVSPTYAREIQTAEHGFGMDGLLRARTDVLSGITNGIDTQVWNPATDDRIPAAYSRTTLERRGANKAKLQRRFGLEHDPSVLLFGVVSRLVSQKGIDLLPDAASFLVEHGAQLALLGTGDADLERRLVSLAAEHPGRVSCTIGYDEDLAHLIQASVDALLMPSRSEPCGLTQLCALRYGAVPVVGKVGGLADTVADPEDSREPTGFHFGPVDAPAFENVLRRVFQAWLDKPLWRRVQLNGMRTDVSWSRPAQQYARLYSDLLQSKK
jgi:starch synthase